MVLAARPQKRYENQKMYLKRIRFRMPIVSVQIETKGKKAQVEGPLILLNPALLF